MHKPIDGVIPVMITPFTPEDRIDYDGVERLVEWYIGHGADALFAVCQSSEMFFLSPGERRDLARFVVRAAAGRVPVIASGHVGEGHDDQLADLRAAADSGADAVILITNRLDGAGSTLIERADALAAQLPGDLDLGFYECPFPYRRLLSDEELRHFADSGRFVALKDVSCDLETVKRWLAITAGTRLAINNANAGIAWDAIQAGAHGFCGIFANFAPDLYAWLIRHGVQHPGAAKQVERVTVLGSMCEAFGYPALAKMYHQRIGTFASAHTRALGYDPREKLFGIEPLLDAIVEAIDDARTVMAAAA